MIAADKKVAAQKAEFRQLLKHLSDDQLREFIRAARVLTATASAKVER
ncbi:hypothetical protein [Azospirillum sp. TSO22-1]|nr:hypothetical protein [Azospirillum sp. TSO22-1]